MAVDKHVFFKDVAKRLAASTLLYNCLLYTSDAADD